VQKPWFLLKGKGIVLIISINQTIEKDESHVHPPQDEQDELGFFEFCKTLNQHLEAARYDGEKLMMLKLVIDQYFKYVD